MHLLDPSIVEFEDADLIEASLRVPSSEDEANVLVLHEEEVHAIRFEVLEDRFILVLKQVISGRIVVQLRPGDRRPQVVERTVLLGLLDDLLGELLDVLLDHVG